MNDPAPRRGLFLDLLVFGGFAVTSVLAPSGRADPIQLALLALAGFVFARGGRASRVAAILCFLLAWFMAPAAGWLPLALLWVTRGAVSRSRPRTTLPAESASHADAPAVPPEPTPPPQPAKPSPDEVERTLREAHGEEWFAAATTHGDAEVRRRAVRELIARGADADPVLLAAVAATDSQAELQLDAIGALGRLRSPAAIEALLTIVARGRDKFTYWPVLEGAVRALARAGDSAVVQQLVEALDTDDSLLPRELREALARFGTPAAAELLDVLTRPDRRQKARAAKTRARVVQKRARIADILARMGHQAACPALTTLLGAEEAPLRAAAAQALGILRNTPARTELTRSLADPDASVRAAAAGALGAVGDAETVEPLLRLGEDTSDQVRRAVVGALGRLADPRALPLLGRLFRVESLRADAAESLVAIGGAGAADVVRSHLEDRDVALHVGALSLLGTLRAGGVSRQARTLLARADPDLRAAAATALGELGDRAATRDLERCLADADGEVRSRAVRALTRLGAAGERILSAAGDPDPRVRESAWDGAAQSAEVSPRDALAAALRDPSPAVRAAAVRAVHAVKDSWDLLEEALDRIPQEVRATAIRSFASDARGARVLVEALPRLGWDSRRCAVDALVALGPAAVAALAGGLEAAPALTRWWRVEGLRRIGGPEAQAALAQVAERDADPRVRLRVAPSRLSAPGVA